MRKRRKLKLVCEDCGGVFIGESPRNRRCPECKMALSRRRGIEYYYKKKIEEEKNATPSKPVPEPEPEPKKHDATLCWGCLNAVPDNAHGCSWSRSLTPVDGWEARPSIKNSDAWFVKACPKFMPDIVTETMESEPKTQGEEPKWNGTITFEDEYDAMTFMANAYRL